ncbi:site-specific DNA-methyltransferase [Clostridium sp. MSJ-11]|uniref:Site-specific DNA-methyltransferase n=1 Tax=Clostridium mobile TaxID=2841512 RepID=A0ABS6EMK3_9CLOT|nr:site-specific DNA-methyltransferase [Clostridium mobile]MBU5486456.1 site-specific DNA-methyltransferase [Clostridium mobile]
MLEFNKIYNMDCSHGLSLLDDNSIDLTVTSPPYDNLRNYNGYTFDFENIAKELYRVTKNGGVVVWVAGDATIKGSETGTSFKQALYFKEVGFNLHDTMIYEKNGCAFPSKNRYYQTFEYMFILSKGKPKTVNLIKDRKNKWGKPWGKQSRRNKEGKLKEVDNYDSAEFGVRFNIWKINNGYGYSAKEKIAYEHPAIFPEQLAKDHILSWSNEGDIVLDIFMGSGTTAKMCIDTNRQYIGFEISEQYCNIAYNRLSGFIYE